MQNSTRHPKPGIQMDALFTKPRQNLKPRIHHRIFRVYSLPKRLIHINTFTSIRRGNGAPALRRKEKEKRLEGGKNERKQFNRNSNLDRWSSSSSSSWFRNDRTKSSINHPRNPRNHNDCRWLGSSSWCNPKRYLGNFRQIKTLIF